MAARRSANGFITLLSVLVASVIGAAVVVSLLQLGLGSTKTAGVVEKSQQAKGLANACGEIALQTIKESTSYTGTDTVTLGAGSCSYTVTSGGGQNRTITTAGTVGTVVRKAKITLDAVSPQIHVVSWQEVADY